MMSEWRLLIDGPIDGALNMARDRSIQLSREAEEVPATVRLYRWRVPTITLGRFQDVSEIDLEACAQHGVDVVRRSTGGRAVLHDDELTYSLVASVSDGIPRGVAASYAMISEALCATYAALGVQAELVRSDSHPSTSSACYLTSTRADLVVHGSKVCGSAQVWHGATVLQHGSITRSRNSEREAAVFGLSAEEQRRLEHDTVTLQSALSQPTPSFDEIADALVTGFEQTLGVKLRSMELSETELETSRILEGTFRSTASLG